MYIGLLKIDSSELDLHLLAHISKHRAKKIQHYQTPFDKKISMYSELLLRVMLRDRGMLNWKEVPVDSKHSGAIFFPHEKSIFVSLSHSENCILCVLDKHNQVGADIERVIPGPYADFEEVLGPAEKRIVQESESDRLEKFFRIWTAKEAYLKYTEEGILRELQQVDTTASFFKKHIIQWKEADFICSIYAQRIHQPVIKLYTEQEVRRAYD